MRERALVSCEMQTRSTKNRNGALVTKHWSADSIAAHSSMPPVVFDDEVSVLQWTNGEMEILQRAEWLHELKRPEQAKRLVADHCMLPVVFRACDAHIARAVRLDLAQWYKSFYGVRWNGQATSLSAARRACTAVHTAHRGVLVHSLDQCINIFRASHLLVEDLASHPHAIELRHHTLDIGWSDALDVGHLQWDSPTGLACCFCTALLLPGEVKVVANTIGQVHGRNCCREGYCPCSIC